MPRVTFSALILAATVQMAFAAEPARSPILVTNHPLEFIDTSFENASPIWYDFAADGTVHLNNALDLALGG